MKRTIMVLMLLLALTCSGLAQAPLRGTTATIATTATATIQNDRGYSSHSFEYVITGSPTSVSVVLSGCQIGATCVVLETSTATASSLRTIAGLYDYFTITPTFSGGTNPTFKVNYVSSAFGVERSHALDDPCASPFTAKQAAVINIGAAATTEIVPLAAGKTIYVCHWAFTLAGTTPSFTFKNGTGTNCGTGTASLSGVMLPTSGSYLTGGYIGTLFSAPVANAVCGTTVGTGSSAQGVLTYVRQ